jgi:hypothetical protein
VRAEQNLGGLEGFDRLDRPPARDWRIIAPGRNAWRVEPSGKAAVLIDGACYFSRLEAALRRAERSILILGWDFDGSIRLRPDVGPDESPPLAGCGKTRAASFACGLFMIPCLGFPAGVSHARIG